MMVSSRLLLGISVRTLPWYNRTWAPPRAQQCPKSCWQLQNWLASTWGKKNAVEHLRNIMFWSIQQRQIASQIVHKFVDAWSSSGLGDSWTLGWSRYGMYTWCIIRSYNFKGCLKICMLGLIWPAGLQLDTFRWYSHVILSSGLLGSSLRRLLQLLDSLFQHWVRPSW